MLHRLNGILLSNKKESIETKINMHESQNNNSAKEARQKSKCYMTPST